jgi:hypothetical protein
MVCFRDSKISRTLLEQGVPPGSTIPGKAPGKAHRVLTITTSGAFSRAMAELSVMISR